MKILTISDTHNEHNKIPKALIDNADGEFDMIIHSGDISMSGYQIEITEFLDWFSSLNFEHKIVIAGNHDFCLDEFPEYAIEAIFEKYPNVTYLNDSGCEINGFKIWGSPITLYFHNYAFNRLSWDIQEHWDMIPKDTEILVTHGPAYGINDQIINTDELEIPDFENNHKGCERLLKTLDTLPNLKLMVHGHIHEGYGVTEHNGALIVNASILNKHNIVWNAPIGVEINKDESDD